MTPEADLTLDRLFRHMAWANARFIGQLQALEDAQLALAAPGNDWTVAMILEHMVGAAGRYADRLEGKTPPRARLDPPTRVAQLADLATRCADIDARLRAQAALPEGVVEYTYDGQVMRRARSTVIAQAIHHATEHRAQMAEALATNGVHAINLDELDLWAYGEAEGLGA